MTRRKYRPGAAIQKAHNARLRQQPMTAEESTTVSIAGHVAMANITQGNGTSDDYWAVRASLEIAGKLVNCGYGETFATDIANGISAIENASKRPKLGFSGDELKAVNLAMDIYDAQLEVATRIDLIKALNQVRQER